MNALALCVLVSLSAAPDTVRLAPGMQLTLKQPGLTKVAVANPEVADVRATGSSGELLLIGKQKGRTNITLWLKGGKQLTRTVIVDDGRSSEIAKMIHELVNPVLDVQTFNGQVIIDGTLDSMEEYNRLHKLVGDDPNVRILAKLNPRVLPFVASQITQAFRKEGIREATAVAVGGRIILEGSVADEEERRKAETIAAAYYAGFQRGQ